MDIFIEDKLLSRQEDVYDIIDCRVARTREELEKAYSLVYREYFKRDYTKENPHGLRFSIYNALPQAATFVAMLDNKDIVATATVIPDSPLGLPMDEIYKWELNKLRSRNKKICEITMLACESEFFENSFLKYNINKLFFMPSLFKILLDYVRDVSKLDVICITINPQHKFIYDFLLFKDLGEEKAYYNVNGAHAIAKYLELASLEEDCNKNVRKRLYRTFLQKKTPLDKFSRKITLSPQDLRYFLTEKSDISETASFFQMEYIKSCYALFPVCLK